MLRYDAAHGAAYQRDLPDVPAIKLQRQRIGKTRHGVRTTQSCRCAKTRQIDGKTPNAMFCNPIQAGTPVRRRLNEPVDKYNRGFSSLPFKRKHGGQLAFFFSSWAFFADAAMASAGLIWRSSTFWICCCM